MLFFWWGGQLINSAPSIDPPVRKRLHFHPICFQRQKALTAGKAPVLILQHPWPVKTELVQSLPFTCSPPAEIIHYSPRRHAVHVADKHLNTSGSLSEGKTKRFSTVLIWWFYWPSQEGSERCFQVFGLAVPGCQPDCFNFTWNVEPNRPRVKSTKIWIILLYSWNKELFSKTLFFFQEKFRVYSSAF